MKMKQRDGGGNAANGCRYCPYQTTPVISRFNFLASKTSQPTQRYKHIRSSSRHDCPLPVVTAEDVKLTRIMTPELGIDMLSPK